MCIDKNGFDPAHLPSAPVQPQQATLKKTKVKSDLLTDIDVINGKEKVIRGGICHAFHQYAKGNSKYMKDYDKNKN